MDFAFPALIILILSLPGIFFILGYKNGNDLIGNLKEGFGDFGDISKAVALGSIVSLLLHSIFTFAIAQALHFFPNVWFIQPVNFGVIVDLMASTEHGTRQTALDDLAKYFPQISAYVLMSSILGGVIGLAIRELVKITAADLRFEILRMDNPWDYFFKGHDDALSVIAKQYGRPKWKFIRRILNQNEIECFVSLLLKTTGHGLIVNGVVKDWEYDAHGHLQTLVLHGATRMNIPQTEVDPIKFFGRRAKDVANQYPQLNYVGIKGDRLVIPYKTVKNMNTIFVYIERKKVTSPDPSLFEEGAGI